MRQYPIRAFMLRRRAGIAFVLATLLLAVPSVETFGQEGLVERGSEIAARECSRCHAVTRVGGSPHNKAPPFRDLPRKYPVEHLAESLAEGIVVGHNDMPEFLFEPDDIEALLAYISGLARQPQ